MAIVFSAVWGLERVRSGVLQGSLLDVNFGLLLTVGLILVQIAGTELAVPVKGLLFIGAGVAFLLVNRSVLARARA
jgi:hypothetical protein